MPPIIARPLPDGALLHSYQLSGAYVDCLTLDVAQEVTLGQFVEAFYTSPMFRPERVILGLLLGMRATDADVAALALGDSARFSAWHVEAREEAQLLLCDFQRRTRSWLMVAAVSAGPGHGATTRLYFGSAVTVVEAGKARRWAARAAFWLLLGFHKGHARLLLWGTARRLGVR